MMREETLRSAETLAKIAFGDDRMAEKTLRTAFRRRHVAEGQEDTDEPQQSE